MSFVAVLKKLRASKSSVAEIEDALGKICIDELESAAEKLEAERRRILLDGSDKELEAVEVRIVAANRDIERGLAAKTELEKRLRDAAAAEADSVRLARYRTAKETAEFAAAKVAKEYPKHAKAIVELIRALAEATAAVQLANDDLPAGADPLPDPEFAVRGIPGSPRKIVNEVELVRWCVVDTGEIPPETLWSKLDQRDHEGSGVIREAGLGNNYEKRRFIRREYLEAEPMIRPDRLASINLPGFAADDPPIWRAIPSHNDVRFILTRLSSLPLTEPVAREDRREVRVEFIPVEDERPAAPIAAEEEQAA